MTKIIGARILVDGGQSASNEVRTLTRSLSDQRREIQKQITNRSRLNKQVKEGSITQGEFAKRIAATELRLKGLRSEYRSNQKSLLQMNGSIKKTGGLTGALTKSFTGLGASLAGAFAVERLIEFGAESVRLAGKLKV